MNNFKNKLEKPVADNWYITGLVDAEGSFGVAISKNASRTLGYIVSVSFEIALQASDKHILEILKSVFGVGGVYKHGSDMYRYKVSSIKDIVTAIIPHFDKFPLVTQKRADFLLFKAIITILSKGVLNKEGLQEIVSYKAVLNRGLSTALKSAFPDTVPYIRPKIAFNGTFNPEWVRGFTEGEGSFFVSLTKNSRFKTGVEVRLGFSLTQHSRDMILLQGIESFFGCGKSLLRSGSLAGDYKVSSVKDLSEIIIPFFEKYPFLGTKMRGFQILCLVVNIVKEKGHLTEEGLNIIRNIKSQTSI
uniref:Homing endonuclease LAGLIDADG domain-containing protein n=1 Tax=Juglanconis juglandina TaxID=1940567 RepID=A0A291LJ18_9PEZI|nr:hypothetical protein [Juglanconis juglandina]